MPKSYAERKVMYVENLKKHGKFDDYKKKKAEQEKARRARIKESLKSMPEVKREKWILENRIKTRISVQKCRERKKGLPETTEDRSIFARNQPVVFRCTEIKHSYKTESACAKAATKTKKTLPPSPSRKKVVVHKILKCLSVGDRSEIIGSFCECDHHKTNRDTTKQKGLSPALIQEIREFYERDDISRMSPNVKDCRNFLNSATGKKELKQIRHLMHNLDKVYDLFANEYKDANDGKDPRVKLSKFCTLRPSHVKLLTSMPHDVCLCPYHSNFIDCCASLNKSIDGFPKYGKGVTEMLVCSEPTRDCWYKKCRNCAAKMVNSKLRAFLTPLNEKRNVDWMQWTKDATTNRTQRLKQQATLKDLLNYFIDTYPKFLRHLYCKREQHKSFNNDVKGITKPQNRHVAVIHADFAENAKFEAQDEVQSAHFNQKQVSVFTSALRHRKSHFSKAIVSDNTHHSKETIVAYFHKLLKKLPCTVKILKMWTDGPSSQFKNKYMAALIGVLEKKFGLKIFWNYLAASHGKGSVDGIGAAVKHSVKRLVISRKAQVNCAEDFFKAFNTNVNSKVELMLLTDDEIQKVNGELGVADVFNNAPKINDISSMHQLQVLNDKVKGFTTSNEGYESYNDFTKSHPE